MAETQIKITADVKQAERAIDGLERSLESLQNSSADVGKALAVITAAASAMGYAILKTLDSAGQLVDAANSLGVSAENLNKLHQAALLAGVGSDTLNMSLQRLSVNLGEGLQKGSGPAVDAVNRLGLSMNEIVNLRPDEQFKKITDEILKIDNPTQRATASVELFGKQGPAILRVAENMAKVAALTKDLGIGVSERDLMALDQAGESLDNLKIIWDAGIKKAVAEIAPYVVAIVEKIKEGIKEAGGFEGIWLKIKSVLNTAFNIMLGIAAVLAIRMVAGAVAFAFQLGRALVAAKGIALVLSRTPIGLISAGIAIAADKMGVDLVGAGKEFLDLNLDIEGANNKINVALADQNKALSANTQVAVGLNEEHKKALAALDETVAKLQNQTSYQRDILNLGETEARIRKVISEEETKLNKVKALNTAEGQKAFDIAKQQIRVAIEEEESLKRQLALRKEQATAIQDIIRGNASPVEQALQKQMDFELLMQGKTQDEIRKMREEATRTNPALRATAEADLAYGVKAAISSEIEKYNGILAVDRKYAEDKKKLDQIIGFADAENLNKQSEYYKMLLNAKAMMDMQYQNDRLAAERAMQEKLQQFELDRITAVLQAERSGMAQIMSEQDRAVLQRVGENERQKAIVQERINFEKKSELEKAQFGIQQGANLFNALGAQNKKAFEAAKAFNIANAIMNTYMAATKALATYPFPFGLVAAAAAVGAGLAQVAQIRAQTYSGRALGGPVMSNQSYIVGENGPEMFTPATTGRIIRNSDIGGSAPVTVNFNITANDTTGFDQLLASRRGVITQIISDAMLERGRRSMV